MIDLEDFARLTDVAWRSTSEVERGIFVAEGLTTIARALAAGCALRSVITEDRWLPGLLDLGIATDCITVHTESQMEQLTGYHVHRGALAAFQRPAVPPISQVLDDARRLVVIEDVVDHANVGAIIRSAAGFAVDAVVLTPGCADPLYRRAIKVSMGNVFKVPWTRIDWPLGIGQLHGAGFTTLALTPHPDADDLRLLAPEIRFGKLALLVGTEGDGLHPKTLRDARYRVRIPMAHGVDSLNVAAATAVACYELAR